MYVRAASYVSQPVPGGFPTSAKKNGYVPRGVIKRFGEAGAAIKVEQQLRTYLYKSRHPMLNYCGRCDIVFILEEKAFDHLDNVDRFLFAPPAESLTEEICTFVFFYTEVFLLKNTIDMVAGGIGPKGYYSVGSYIHGHPSSSTKAKDENDEYKRILDELVSAGWSAHLESEVAWNEIIWYRKIKQPDVPCLYTRVSKPNP